MPDDRMTELVDHWERTRVALLHDSIRAFNAEPPPGVTLVTRLRLEAAADALKAELKRLDSE